MNLLSNKFGLIKFFKKNYVIGLGYLILVAFIIHSLLSNFGPFLTSPDSKSSLVSKAENPHKTLLDKDYKQITDRNIFNELGDIPNEESVKRTPIPSNEITKTLLPLKLSGILYTGNPKSGLISLNLANKNIHANYSVGDLLFKDNLNSVILVEIHQKKIIILNEGKKEYLELNPTSMLKAKKTSLKTKKVAFISKDSYEEEGLKREGQNVTITKEYKQKLLTTEFASILRDVRALPYRDPRTKKFIGYRLTQLRPGSIFDKVGLKTYDIVTEINGAKLGNASQAVKYLQSLRDSEEVQMEVIRNGKKQEFQLQVQ